MSFLKEFGFCLGGGTAVAIYYGHRRSEDFDFFKIGKLNELELIRFFSKLNGKLVFQKKDTLYFDIDGIKVSLFGVDFNFLERCVDCRNFLLMSKIDLVLMKLVAIMQRGSFKDYVDLYFLFKNERYNLKSLLELLSKKYNIQVNEKIILDALVFMDDLNEGEVEFIGEKIPKDQIYIFFKRLVKNYYENS